MTRDEFGEKHGQRFSCGHDGSRTHPMWVVLRERCDFCRDLDALLEAERGRERERVAVLIECQAKALREPSELRAALFQVATCVRRGDR